MKEVCGFKDKGGRFHDTEESCKRADLEYEIRSVQSKLNYLPEQLERILSSYPDASLEFFRYKSLIMNTVAKCILRDSDAFIEIINNKRQLEATLDELHRISKYKPWWMKVIWWK
tara:strand:+ start:1216 stop:1560 length:345 start_codon:yes stop_codon:yes gene_type:complete